MKPEEVQFRNFTRVDQIVSTANGFSTTVPPGGIISRSQLGYSLGVEEGFEIVSWVDRVLDSILDPNSGVSEKPKPTVVEPPVKVATPGFSEPDYENAPNYQRAVQALLEGKSPSSMPILSSEEERMREGRSNLATYTPSQLELDSEFEVPDQDPLLIVPLPTPVSIQTAPSTTPILSPTPLPVKIVKFPRL